MNTLLIIIGIACLNALSYESPYHNAIVNTIRKSKPYKGLKLFIFNLLQCIVCYSFWFDLTILLLLNYGVLSIFYSALSSVLGLVILNKIIRKI